MQAVIICGGRGTRLRPLTNLIPKPLLPLSGVPILEIILQQLRDFGFRQITLAAGLNRKPLQSFAGDGRRWGLNIDYIEETQPLGTAGPLMKLARMDENFLVMNGDILTDLNFRKFLRGHIESEADLTVATWERKGKLEYGLLELDESNSIIEYREKPEWRHLISAGIYAVTKTILQGLPSGGYLDFPDLIAKLIRKRRRVRAELFRGNWMDIGRPDDFALAQAEFEKNPDIFCAALPPLRNAIKI